MANITVHPATLRRAVEDSQENPDFIAAAKTELRELPQWLTQDEPFQLSFTKISQLGKALHIPFGYLVRSVLPPKESEPLLQYRTVNNGQTPVSKNLEDVIQIMRARQDWAHDEMLFNGLGANTVVGSQSGVTNPIVLGQSIREVLHLEDTQILERNDAARFNYVRRQASQTGLMIMVDSMVSGSRRRLRIEECRAFVLLDDAAPLIFINRNDSQKAMLFSLLHEVGHVLLGSEELFNADDSAMDSYNLKTEQIINSAVAYALVPTEDFRSHWNEYMRTSDASIWNTAMICAHRYGLSAIALTIHAKELGIASEHDVKTVRELTQQVAHKNDQKTNSGGGNQNLTNAYHLDDRYVTMVHDSVQRGTVPFTDGLALLGLHSVRAYDGLMEAKGLNQ